MGPPNQNCDVFLPPGSLYRSSWFYWFKSSVVAHHGVPRLCLDSSLHTSHISLLEEQFLFATYRRSFSNKRWYQFLTKFPAYNFIIILQMDAFIYSSCETVCYSFYAFYLFIYLLSKKNLLDRLFTKFNSQRWNDETSKLSFHFSESQYFTLVYIIIIY